MTRAAVLRDTAAPLSVEDVVLAPTGPDQVRVRLRATGVCHSDLSIVRGGLRHPLPAVPGHEGAGVVTEVGANVTSVAPGDHVTLNWTPSCGACYFCSRGEPYLCDRAVADSLAVPYAALPTGEALAPVLGSGAFAEETLVLERAVVKIPEDVPFEVAALVGCAVTTGFGAVHNTARVRPGDTVVVVGCGGVGLSIVQGARYAGASPIVAVDLSDEKLALAKDLGATDTVDGTEDVEAAVRALTQGRGADHAFEAIGRGATIRTAYRLTRRGGNTVVVGAGRHDDKVEFSALELFFQGRAILGCVYGGADVARDFPRILGLYASGDLDLDRLITDRIRLDDVNDALAAMEVGRGARSVILFD
jgi:S-(hydroxymethyl)glutathione dehydrogenase/alcohol dehydrogenase